MPEYKSSMTLNSTEFSHQGHIPPKYTCEGENTSPPLEFNNVPEGTKTLALIMDDPDAPRGTFDHWIVWNIYPNEVFAGGSSPGINGTNSFGKTGYGGPCPPSGAHRYYFRLYALDTVLDLLPGSDKKTLLEAMKGHIIEQTELMGLYQKKTVAANKQ